MLISDFPQRRSGFTQVKKAFSALDFVFAGLFLRCCHVRDIVSAMFFAFPRMEARFSRVETAETWLQKRKTGRKKRLRGMAGSSAWMVAEVGFRLDVFDLRGGYATDRLLFLQRRHRLPGVAKICFVSTFSEEEKRKNLVENSEKESGFRFSDKGKRFYEEVFRVSDMENALFDIHSRVSHMGSRFFEFVSALFLLR